MGLFYLDGRKLGRARRTGVEDGPNGPFFVDLEGVSEVRTSADKERLIGLIEPALSALGYELVDLDLKRGRRGLLRVYIDRKSADEGGVTLADCELVSGQVGALLDVEDPIPGAYDLEISSPGLDRKLRTPAHFERFAGEEVRIELSRARDGRKRLKGLLKGIEDDKVVVDVDGNAWRLSLDEIDEARLVPPKSA